MIPARQNGEGCSHPGPACTCGWCRLSFGLRERIGHSGKFIIQIYISKCVSSKKIISLWIYSFLLNWKTIKARITSFIKGKLSRQTNINKKKSKFQIKFLCKMSQNFVDLRIIYRKIKFLYGRKDGPKINVDINVLRRYPLRKFFCSQFQFL